MGIIIIAKKIEKNSGHLTGREKVEEIEINITSQGGMITNIGNPVTFESIGRAKNTEKETQTEIMEGINIKVIQNILDHVHIQTLHPPLHQVQDRAQDQDIIGIRDQRAKEIQIEEIGIGKIEEKKEEVFREIDIIRNRGIDQVAGTREAETKKKEKIKIIMRKKEGKIMGEISKNIQKVHKAIIRNMIKIIEAVNSENKVQDKNMSIQASIKAHQSQVSILQVIQRLMKVRVQIDIMINQKQMKGIKTQT